MPQRTPAPAAALLDNGRLRRATGLDELRAIFRSRMLGQRQDDRVAQPASSHCDTQQRQRLFLRQSADQRDQLGASAVVLALGHLRPQSFAWRARCSCLGQMLDKQRMLGMAELGAEPIASASAGSRGTARRRLRRRETASCDWRSCPARRASRASRNRHAAVAPRDLRARGPGNSDATIR